MEGGGVNSFAEKKTQKFEKESIDKLGG